MVMYTGADWSGTGLHLPFTILYAIFDILYCKTELTNHQICSQSGVMEVKQDQQELSIEQAVKESPLGRRLH